MIAQLECLSEETHIHRKKIPFGLLQDKYEYKTKQMASPSNNMLYRHKVRENQHKQLATFESRAQPQITRPFDRSTLNDMNEESGAQKSCI